MTMQNQKLENYLTALDRALTQIATSDRAEIILEIKSHILDASEKGEDIDNVLASLGSADTVANRYLLERGMKINKTEVKKRNIFTKLIWAAVIAFCVFMLGIVLIVWKFTPIIKVDEQADSVTILGGLIDIKGGMKDGNKNAEIKIGDNYLKADKSGKSFAGETTLDLKKLKVMEFDFTNGNFKLKTSFNGKFKWDCKASNDMKIGTDGFIKSDTAVGKINLEKAENLICEFEFPKGANLKFRGTNSIFNILEPKYNLEIDTTNIKADIEPEFNTPIRYVFDTTNAIIDKFESKEIQGAYEIKIKAVNGKIGKK